MADSQNSVPTNAVHSYIVGTARIVRTGVAIDLSRKIEEEGKEPVVVKRTLILDKAALEILQLIGQGVPKFGSSINAEDNVDQVTGEVNPTYVRLAVQ